VARWADTAKTALKDIGWRADVVDGKNDPAVFQQAITSFINQRVAGIITIVIDAAPIRSALQAAAQAKIPVIAAASPVDPSGANLFSAEYAVDPDRLGKMIADYLVKKEPAGAQYVTLDLPGDYAGHEPIVAANAALKSDRFKLAGNFDISTADILGSTTKGSVDVMSAHPDAKVMIGCCDFTPSLTVPALKQAGFGTVLQTATSDNLSTLKLIRDGSPVMTIAYNGDIGVLTAIDQILSHSATGAAIDRNAASGKWKYDTVDRSNVPPAGQFVFDPATQAAPFVAKWKAMESGQ